MPRGEHSKPDKTAPHVPTEEEIEERKRQIREEGYRDHKGNWHPPWVGQYEPET